MARMRKTMVEQENLQFNGFVLANMKRLGITEIDIADVLEISQQAVSKRVRGVTRWTLDDMTKVCELLGEPYTVGAIR